MGIKTTKVWLVVAACLLPWCAAGLCPTGLQYWSNDSETCVNCSRCDASAKQVVIRPCVAHADTVCGPISDLNIDWSWLKPHSPGKHHGKKSHKHFADLGDDIVTHSNVLDDEGEETTVKPTKHQGRKHHKHDLTRTILDDEDLNEKRRSQKHHISSESLLSEDFDSPSNHRLFRKLPPPPPLKSTDDLEREWKELLIQSKNRLQHEKDDLLKNLHKEKSKPYNEKHHTSLRLNRPTDNIFDDSDTEIFHHSSHHKHDKHFSPLELELFDRLVSHQHQRLSISQLLSGEKKRPEERDRADDLAYPMDSFDFRSVVPTHRLFLGEPSTVSEIMDQDLSEEVEDERFLDDKDPEVVAVPFTAAETLVWDWQAVALASAVAACLLFFSVVAIYSLLQARQWRRLKNNIDTDMEELSVKVGLMSGVGASAAEGVNTNIYLENLLENKKKTSNIYTQKRPVS